MTTKAKPFIKWVGGKTQLIESIQKALPENFAERNNVTYVEPFVGGGAVLFWILQQYTNITKAIINDINPDLTTAYQTIKKAPSELVKFLQIIQDEYLILNEVKRKEYYLNKRERFNTKSLDSIENTALFIFLNHTCYNGLYRVNSKGLFNVPFGRYANPKICDKQTIFADSKILRKVEILKGDFEATLKYASNSSFFYFDPPYKPLSETSSFNSYAKEVFDDNEQIRLVNFCKKIDILGHNFILSNSDGKCKNPNNVFFDELYGQFSIKRVFANRMVNANADKRGKLTELLITNQPSKSTQFRKHTNRINKGDLRMTKEEIFELMKKNPGFHLATIDDGKPRCRAMFLYSADENGIVFHTGAMKDVFKQINKNPNVELCFNDYKSNVQIRVSGKLEEVDNNAYKDEICAHPTRAFLKPWRESGQLENFYSTFKVFRLKSGKALVWNMETNFAPKVEILL